MTRDELEFSISQYLDGTLAGDEEAALEARLAVDADARALLAEYRTLDAALKAAPLPAVDWDKLAAHVCGAVAREEEPATSYRIGFVRTMTRLALAACVLVGLGFGIRMLQRAQTNPTGGAVAQKPTKPPVEIVVVDASPAAPAASTEPVGAIVVGPSTERPSFASYHDDVISRPSEVLVARGGETVHDASFLP
jgi:anti-sigma factor RsiW